MPRLNIERQQKLEPIRMAKCLKTLRGLGFDAVEVNPTKIEFFHQGARISFWPYTGWHSGKTINQGRGMKHLLEQLKSK